jgi:Argininosuccinate lyase
MLCGRPFISTPIVHHIASGFMLLGEAIIHTVFIFHSRYGDIHMHIEKRLFPLFGGDAGYVHTGRSSDDPVITDF